MMRPANLFLAIAAMAFALLLSVSDALAYQATARSGVNVRSGPGTGFAIVDALHRGETVSVGECRASRWCYVQHSGPDGWVYSSFLNRISGSGASPNQDCGLNLNFGTGGPTLSINCGSTPPPPAPTPPPAPIPAQACFYTGQNFSGTRFCQGLGTRNWLSGTYNNRISSISVQGGVKVRICTSPNQVGYCRVVSTNQPILYAPLNNRASSFVVFNGLAPAPHPAPPPVPLAPVTYSTGGINLPQSFKANLENGHVVSGGGTDIFYEAFTPMNKFLKPINGARLALGDGSNRGYAGCRIAAFSTMHISIWAMPPGTYVCAQTNVGRISQFRVNSIFGPTVNLGYTTWQ